MCGNLPLRVFFSLIQSVSHFQYKFFSWRKFIFQFFIKLLNIVLQMNPLWNICFCRFDDIVEVDFISFPICADRFIKRDFMAAFFSGAQIHQDFIFYTAGGIGSQTISLFRIERNYSFDQANRADGNQIFRIFTGILVFPYNMGNETEIAFN